MSTENGTTTPFIPRQRKPAKDTATRIFPFSIDKGNGETDPMMTDFRPQIVPADAPEEPSPVAAVEEEVDPKDSSVPELVESPESPSRNEEPPPLKEEAPPEVKPAQALPEPPAPETPAAKVSTPPRVRAPGKPRS